MVTDAGAYHAPISRFVAPAGLIAREIN